jgi:hypothetical protein
VATGAGAQEDGFATQLPGGAGRIGWLREEGYGPNARDEHHNGDRDCRDHDANGELYLDQPISDRYSQLWGARHNGRIRRSLDLERMVQGLSGLAPKWRLRIETEKCLQEIYLPV